MKIKAGVVQAVKTRLGRSFFIEIEDIEPGTNTGSDI